MLLSFADWAILIAVLAITLATGLFVSRRAGKSSASFFLGNRNMPWWLLGLSMVATTFAADTPNLVTQLVRSQGVSGNWMWWSMLLTGMLTTFIYAKLWRRLGVTTDVEFYTRRYGGRPAHFLRGFRALYLGLFFNIVIMANVTLAAIKISGAVFAASPETTVIIAGIATAIFAAGGGFLGVLITDMMLFVLAMAGAILAAWFAVNHPDVGGLSALINHPDVAAKLSILPDMSNPNQYVPVLLVPLLVQWWSVWYPGSEPGGGGYVAQRMLAAKDEKHAVAASAFFNFCHYAVRPWPWILVALASLAVFPDFESMRAALPHVPDQFINDDLAYSAMLTLLPHGVLGIVVASLAAAYISTISTSLNWGASYIVNDFYSQFVNRNASERELVRVGRIATLVLMVLAGFLALALESALQAFRLILSIGAGTGLLFLIRWFWFRINVWSEVSAMVFSFAIAMFFEFGPWSHLLAWEKLLYSVGATTLGWIAVTLLTKPVEGEQIERFKNSIRSSGLELRTGLFAAVWASAGIYATLFTVGMILYDKPAIAAALAILALVSAFQTLKYYRASSSG